MLKERSVLTLPPDIMAVLTTFAPLFTRPVWQHVQVLLVGAILAPGRRMVSSVLRVMGLEQVASFGCYHRVLNRAVWSSREASHLLLILVIRIVAPSGPLVLGIDETIERRRGRKITAAGYYRDPVRSTKRRKVTTRGLRWISLMVLVPLPWAHRVWALPFLTVLAPAKQHTKAQGRRHKTIAVWARQMLRQVHRWLPTRSLVVVGDGEYAAMDLLRVISPFATVVTRLRLDAQLFEPPPPRKPGQRGRPRRVGAVLPKLAARGADPTTVWTSVTIPEWYGQGPRTIELLSETAHWYNKSGQPAVPLRWVLIRDPQGVFPMQALLCTDLDADPVQIITWFIMRWRVEVTFHEVRDHLGVETQRQWSPLAILRTTPALLGLFSLVTLLAHPHMMASAPPVRAAAWYDKQVPTFVDALALVRRQLWATVTIPVSPADTDMAQIPRSLIDHLYQTLAYAA